jgi:uncharacterized repeat protein (TIGR04138 family)
MSHAKQAELAPAKYHPAAYEFVDQALRFSQKKFGKPAGDSHISGQQLLEGIRDLALREFGLMAIPVFRHWGITTTEDFGRIVWEMIEHDCLRKTDHDQLSDFCGVYEFDDAFDREYELDTSAAFRR